MLFDMPSKASFLAQRHLNKEVGDVVIKRGRTTLNADLVILGPGTKVEKCAELVVNIH